MKILGIFLSKEIRTGGHIRCLELMEGLAAGGDDVELLLNAELAYQPRAFRGTRLSAAYKRKSWPSASAVFKRSTARWLDERGPADPPAAVIVFGESHLRAGIEASRRLGASLLFGLQSNTVKESLISLAENAARPWRLPRVLVELLLYRSYERQIAASCDGIVFQSSFDRDDFCARNPRAREKSYVVGGNIGLPRFTDENRGGNSSASLRKILFMGTLGERKGLRYLLQAFAELWAEGRSDLELHVAGPGQDKDKARFQRYAEEKGFAKALTFYGRVPSTFPLMSSCDLMVAPSLFDSYPDVILLGLHAGIPVIGSRTGGIPDMLSRDELLFPTRDGHAIAAIIKRCLDEPGHYAALRALCEARREAFLFDWPAAWRRVAERAAAR